MGLSAEIDVGLSGCHENDGFRHGRATFHGGFSRISRVSGGGILLPTSVVTNLPHFLFQKLSEECSEPSFAPKFWGVRVLGGVYLVEFPFQSPFRPPSWYTGFQNA